LKGLGTTRGTATHANGIRFARAGLAPLLGILLLLAPALATASGAPAAQGAVGDASREVVEIILDPTALSAGDRERSRERIDDIAQAIESNIPLFGSYDPRETLAESLKALADLGVEIDSALVNFDSIETSIPFGAREKIETLPWVSQVRDPVGATPTGLVDSQGVEEIGADLAQAAGVIGSGIKVAIIDDSFNNLTATSSDPNDELPVIPTASQYRVNQAGNSATNPFQLNGTGSQALEGEHGTAAAEVIYEVAPGVDFILLGFQVQASGNQYEFGVTATQIEFAIRKAVDDLGAKVILVPMYIFHTMGDPVGTGQGGKNTFTDDIDYATAAGATVVVPSGNEALRHVIEPFTPCTDCDDSVSGQCSTADNDTAYHAWDPESEALPLNDLFPTSEVELAEFFETLTCYTATDAANPSDFEVRLMRYSDASDDTCDFPGCPSDCGVSAVAGTTRDLNQGFTRGGVNGGPPVVEGPELNEITYYLAIRRKGGTSPLCQTGKCIQNGTTSCSNSTQCQSVPWPKIRVACTTGVDSLYWSTDALDPGPPLTGGQQLSDLAVVVNAVTVGGLDAFGDLLFESSLGPTSQGENGPVKPDVVAPGEVDNFTFEDYAVSDTLGFYGTSAAAAHVAGLAALLQQQAFDANGSYLSPANVRELLKRGAIPLGGLPLDEFLYGAGLVHIPDPAPGPYDFYPVTPCRAIDTRVDPGPNGGASQPLQGNVERVFSLAGVCGIPLDAGAISANFSIISPTLGGFATLFPADSLRPLASAINFPAGANRRGNALLKVSDNGEAAIRAYIEGGTAHLVLDVDGYFK
jgi:subtilisin family serine protease